ncbi:MAG: SOS response-associated peptidase family protein [Burkholderiaceae bacterium]
MCANYQPVTRMDRLLTYFGVERKPDDVSPPEIWPLGMAPFIRLHEEGSGNKVVEDGVFGLLPHFAKELAYGRRTYNARSETIHQLPSFRDSWERARRCIIPAEAIFEQCYETGKAVRWCIRQPGDVPMGIAGLYRPWRGPDGRLLWTFAMTTVNAAGHPVYERMHAPGEEKRMVTILHPQEYDRWLLCPPAEAVTFFTQWHGPLEAFPAPLPPRGRKAAP